MFKYFNIDTEFTCKCGCGEKRISPQFVLKLDYVRDDCGFPLNITSGCRCAKHNANVGGSASSSHMVKEDTLKSYAVDIGCDNAFKRYHIVRYAMKHRIKRIGIAKNFVHLDDDPIKSREVIWVY